MTEEEFLHEVNDALRRPPSAEPSTTTTVSGRSAERSTGRSAENSSRGLPSLPFTLPTTPAAAAGSATAMMDEGPRVGFSKLVGGVSAIAAPPLAAANAIAAGVVKGAEGVASALAGLSLGLGGGGGDGDGGKGGSGFSNPPQAVEVREGLRLSMCRHACSRFWGELMYSCCTSCLGIRPRSPAAPDLSSDDTSGLRFHLLTLFVEEIYSDSSCVVLVHPSSYRFVQ